MIRTLALLCLCLSMQASNLFAEPGRNGIEWLTSYDEAIKKAQATQKPIVLFFTGSDWCGWCTKLEEESLNTPQFAEAVGDKLIFVKLDFPMYKAQDPKITAQNKQLQKRFDVRSYPSIIILDANQNKIGNTGYRAGGGKQFAAHLFGIVNDYSSYKQKMSSLDSSHLDGKELKQLYQKASEFHFASDLNKIVKKGLDSDKSLFFLTEKYRVLVNEGRIHDKEAKAIKAQLIAMDPQNERYTFYNIALIEFEAYCEEMETEKYSCDLAVAPLIDYINKHHGQDSENIWRLNMIISQVYLDRNNMEQALKYAKLAQEAAPETAQNDLTSAVRNIESQIKHSSYASFSKH